MYNNQHLHAIYDFLKGVLKIFGGVRTPLHPRQSAPDINTEMKEGIILKYATLYDSAKNYFYRGRL